jgi:hypothetical protein
VKSRDVPDLHDARVDSLLIDFQKKTVTLDIEYYESESSTQRKKGSITFTEVSAVNQVLDLREVAANRKAGNVNYWQPAEKAGSTFVYLVHGCLILTSAKPQFNE